MSTRIEAIIDKQRSSYPFFRRDQLLSASELNDLFTYLDRQNRDTRIFGVGIGVMYGIEAEYGARSIDIDPGIAISSDGQLFHLFRSCTLKQAENYILNNNAFDCETIAFTDQASSTQAVLGVLQLTEGEPGTPGNLDQNIPADEYFLILYREISKTTSSGGAQCLISSNLSSENRAINNYFLLVPIDEYNSLIARPSSIDDAASDSPSTQISNASIKRLGYDSTNTSIDISQIKSLRDFTGSYKEILEEAKIATELVDAIQEAYETVLLFEPSISIVPSDLLNRLQNIIDSNAPIQYQYIYDYFQDLVDALYEFNLHLLKIRNIEGRPFDSSLICAHPNHVILAQVTVSGNGINVDDTKRSLFRSTAPEVVSASDINKLVFLYERFIKLVDMSNLRLTNLPGAGSIKPNIRITPGKGAEALLSERPIPFYYRADLLKNYWSYELKDIPSAILSYHPVDSTNPLFDELTNTSFFRIEGYEIYTEGENKQTLSDVFKEINNLKSQFDLPFEIHCLSLTTLNELGQLKHARGFLDLERNFQREKAGLICELVRVGISDDVRQMLNEWDNVSGKDLNAIGKLEIEIRKNIQDQRIFEILWPRLLSYVEEYLLKFELASQAEQLSTFTQCYPGLNHQAGVASGGTFFLVYLPGKEKMVVGDFSLPYIRSSWEIPLENYTKGQSILLSPSGNYCTDDDKVYPLVGYPMVGLMIGNLFVVDKDENDVKGLLEIHSGDRPAFRPTAFKGKRQIRITYSLDNTKTDPQLILDLFGILSLDTPIQETLAPEGWKYDPQNTPNLIRISFSFTFNLVLDGGVTLKEAADQLSFFFRFDKNDEWAQLDPNGDEVLIGDTNQVKVSYEYTNQNIIINDPIALEAQLQVEYGPCLKTLEIPLSFPITTIRSIDPIILEPKGPFCINDSSRYALKARPTGGTWRVAYTDVTNGQEVSHQIDESDFIPNSLSDEFDKLPEDKQIKLEYEIILPDRVMGPARIDIQLNNLVHNAGDGIISPKWENGDQDLVVTVSPVKVSFSPIQGPNNPDLVRLYWRHAIDESNPEERIVTLPWDRVFEQVPADGTAELEIPPFSFTAIGAIEGFPGRLQLRFEKGPCKVETPFLEFEVPAKPVIGETGAIVSSSEIEDPITLLNRRQQSDNNEIGALIIEESYATLTTVSNMLEANNLPPNSPSLDRDFDSAVKKLIGQIKTVSGDRLDQHLRLLELSVRRYLDKKLSTAKDLMGPELSGIFTELKSRSEETSIDWSRIRSYWNAEELKSGFESSLVDQFDSLLG